MDLLEDDVDGPGDADEEEGEDDLDIIEEDVFTGENDSDDDFIDEQDANASDQDASEPGSEDDQDAGDVEDLPFEEEEEGRRDSAGGSSLQSDSGDRKKVHSRPPPPPPPAGAATKPGPPPPPPAPAPTPRSALSSSVLGSLQSAARESLRKVAPPPEPKVDDRAHLLRSIQLGSAQLKGAPSKPAAPFQKIAVQVRNNYFCVVHTPQHSLDCEEIESTLYRHTINTFSCLFSHLFQQNEAVAAILANRSKIAGSDTESSDDSDSDYTDDDY